MQKEKVLSRAKRQSYFVTALERAGILFKQQEIETVVCIWLFPLLLFIGSNIRAQPSIHINKNEKKVSLKGHLAIYKDFNNQVAINQIVSGQLDEHFLDYKLENLNLGHVTYPVWLRFVVVKSTDEPLYLKSGNPNLDSVTLYGLEGERLTIQQAYFDQRMEEKEIFSNEQILSLSQETHSEKTWYIRLRSNITPLQFSGTIAPLTTFVKEQTTNNLLFGVYAGIIILASLISLFWYITFRDVTYLYYIGYNLFFLNTVMIITGYYSLVYPKLIIPAMNTYFTLVNLVWLLFITAFSGRFLEVKKNAPKWRIGIRLIYLITLTLIGLVLLKFNVWVYQLFEIFALLVSGYLIILAIKCLLNGYWLAKFYLAGFGALIFTGAMVIFTNFGLFSFMDTGYHGLKIGHMIEIIFFMFGLVQRTANINKEKEQYLQAHNEIEMIFGQQVSKEIVQQLLLTKGEFPSQRMNASILFLDIRNFTPFAEAHSPEEVIHFQNTVFNEFITIIDQHEGIITTMLGDGLLATFGTPISKPDHASQAVRAGLLMIQTIHELSAKNIIPPTRIGVGIHSGLVLAGNIGNEIRKEFSLSGLTVIIASRIEQLNKELGTECLITKEVVELIDPNEFRLTSFGCIPLKGIENAVEIFGVDLNRE